MVKIIIGDMFKSEMQTLVNTVNCVGIMGKGIALEFKNRFPDMYDDYVKRCEKKEVKLGQPYLYKERLFLWILNFPTKDHWRSVSRLEDIIRGLKHLEQNYQKWGITSLAVPPLGCGHGQLEWKVVGPTLYRHLKQLDIPVELYAPHGTLHEELQPAFLDQSLRKNTAGANNIPANRIQPAWFALVNILNLLEHEPFHWPVGRVTFQKIAYFATVSGIPTNLQYQRGSFGPYAPELKPLITRLVNNGLIREEQLGKMFAIKIGPTFNDAFKAYKPEIEKWNTVMDKVADLFMRMRTNQAELAATIHFAALTMGKKGGEGPTEVDVLTEVMKWKQRRRPPLNEAEVALAIRNLSMLSWLKVKASLNLPVNEEVLLGV